jgi:hypothetical protein
MTKTTFMFSIELFDVNDSTIVRLPPFGANRLIEDNNVYLYNEKKGFKEPFPENSAEYKEYKEEELKENIAKLENDLEKAKKNPINYSIKDIKKNLRINKNFLRSLELQGAGSYMFLNEQGVRTFTFHRKGDTKVPVFQNIDYSLIYAPTEMKIKEVVQLRKENDEKNGEQKRVTWATYGLVIILVLGVCFMFFMGWKMMSLPGEVTNNLDQVAKSMADITKDLYNVSSNINIIASDSISQQVKVTPGVTNVTGR